MRKVFATSDHEVISIFISDPLHIHQIRFSLVLFFYQRKTRKENAFMKN